MGGPSAPYRSLEQLFVLLKYQHAFVLSAHFYLIIIDLVSTTHNTMICIGLCSHFIAFIQPGKLLSFVLLSPFIFNEYKPSSSILGGLDNAENCQKTTFIGTPNITSLTPTSNLLWFRYSEQLDNTRIVDYGQAYASL